MSTRSTVLALYRQLLQHASQFPQYNYREYALQKIRDTFRAQQSVRAPEDVQQLIDKAQDALSLIQRQVSIQSLYVKKGETHPGKRVRENDKPHTHKRG